MKSVTFRSEAETSTATVEDENMSDEPILDTPIHDTGSKLYALASFLLPPIGLIAGLIFKKFKHIRNYKACKKGALIGLGLIGSILLLFGILLVSALI